MGGGRADALTLPLLIESSKGFSKLIVFGLEDAL
jgi:hypothetical protein